MMAQRLPFFNPFLVFLSTLISSFCHGQLTQHFEIYGLKTRSDIQKFKSYGVNQVILDNHQLLITAQEMGLRTVQANWFGLHTPWNQVKQRVHEAFALTCSLVSINLMDEPIYNGVDKFPPEYYLELEKQIHQLQQTLPLSLTEHGPSQKWSSEKTELFRKYLPAISQLRIDPYPVISHEPLSEIFHWIQRARKLMEPKSMPLTVILQTWVENGNLTQMPSISQLRVMAYQALLSEVEVISFFDYQSQIWSKIPAFEMDFANLLYEMKTLSQKYRSCSLHTTMSKIGILSTQIDCPDSSQHFIEVNTNDKPTAGLNPYEVRFPDAPQCITLNH